MSRRQPERRSDRTAESDGSDYTSTTVGDASRRRSAGPFRDRTSQSSTLGRPGRSLLSISGICLLTATKFTDALTTGIGVAFVPGVYEANPVVDAAIRELGITLGLIMSSVVVVSGIVILTELAAIWVSLRQRDGHLAPLVRLTGYGIPAVLFALVSVYNVHVLLAGIEATGPV